MRGIVHGLVLAAALAVPGAAGAGTAEIHSFHCLHGCPMGAAETNDLLVREIYTLSSSDLTKMADWVAYRVTKDTIGPSGARAWKADPWLAPEETLEPDDYKGAPKALSIDRGHQAPLASFSGTPHAAETNYLSNITPQKAALNQAPWMRLESAERTLARTVDVYVATGPLYEAEMPTLPEGDEPHRMPSGYWKVVATEGGGVTRVAAFIMAQETPRAAAYCSKRVPLEEVERRALLRLFPRLDPAARAFQPLDAALGCPAKETRR